MHSAVALELDGMGCVTHGSNKQKLLLWNRKRWLWCLSSWMRPRNNLVTLLVHMYLRQLSVMLLRIMGKSEQTQKLKWACCSSPRTDTADQSCEFNCCYIRTYSKKKNLPILYCSFTIFQKLQKTKTSEYDNFCFFYFPIFINLF